MYSHRDFLLLFQDKNRYSEQFFGCRTDLCNEKKVSLIPEYYKHNFFLSTIYCLKFW